MKKTYLSILIVLAVHLIANSGFTQNVRGLQIGDKVPDIVFSKMINYPVKSMKLSEIQGKFILLDFWAPWCSPCLQSLVKIDSMKRKFNKLFVVSSTLDKKELSLKTLEQLQKNKNLLPVLSAVEDTATSKLFPHEVIPHIVWIDSNLVVKAITSHNEVTEANILKFINSGQLQIKAKNDEEVYNLDYMKPFFSSSPILQHNEMLAHSVFTKFIQGVATESTQWKGWVRCTNHSVLLMYKIAFGKFDFAFMDNGRIILEGFRNLDDSLQIGFYVKEQLPFWEQIQLNHMYTYEIQLPDSAFSRDQKFEFMQHEINRYFKYIYGITGKIEKRKSKYLALVRTSTNNKLRTTGGLPKEEHSDYLVNIQNMPIGFFVSKMQAFIPNTHHLPILDETKYSANVDISLTGNLSDIDEINWQLQKYDLKFVERETSLEMIVLSKNEVNK